MPVQQSVLMNDVQSLLDECRKLFNSHTEGLVRFGDDVVLRAKLKGEKVEFSNGGEVYFFNAGRTAQGTGTKQSRSPNYFYISDGKKQLTVKVNGKSGPVTLTLTVFAREERKTG